MIQTESIQQAGQSYKKLVWKTECGYRREALAENRCPDWLPVCFLTENGVEAAYYNDTGYLSLQEHCNKLLRQGKSLVRFLAGALRRLAESELVCEDFLLSRDWVCYRAEYIFVRERDGSVAMMYVPAAERQSFSERVSGLLEELSSEYPESGVELLKERFEGYREEGAFGSEELLRLFGRWEREV